MKLEKLPRKVANVNTIVFLCVCLQIVQAISQGAENDLMIHYIFMDNEFELPTSAGLQLQVAFSGIATPGAKVGMKISQRNVSFIFTLILKFFQ